MSRLTTRFASITLLAGLAAVPLFAEEHADKPLVDPLGGEAAAVTEGPITWEVTHSALAPRDIDLAICLDTSGSMSGLIESAKQRLWALVNDLAVAEPTPRLRVALLTYGSPSYGAEDGYVHVQVPLTDDLDMVSMKLFELGTDGGDEYVARVTDSAAKNLAWSKEEAAVKMIVVAGNEAATQDPQVTLEQACGFAIEKGIVVSSLYCREGGQQAQTRGSNSLAQTVAPANAAGPTPIAMPLDDIALGWKRVATLADGAFAMIDQDSGVVIMETPLDDKLAALSTEINGTYIPYGSNAQWACSNQAVQDANAIGLNNEAAASRALTKGGGLYVCGWDLVDALEGGTVEPDAIDRELLGEEHKELTDDELLALVDTKRAERAKIRAAIAELGEQREAWLVNERETLGVDESASFDSPIRFALRDLAETRGFVFPAPKLAEVKAEQTAEEAEAVQAIELPVGGLREVGKNEVLEGC